MVINFLSVIHLQTYVEHRMEERSGHGEDKLTIERATALSYIISNNNQQHVIIYLNDFTPFLESHLRCDIA